MGHIYKAIVIGAGITGLACAFRLRQLGIPALLLEASNQAGGLISSLRRNGFLFEAGPQGPRFPQPVWTLVRELKLENDFLPGDPKAKRYILRDGHLHLAPLSPMSLLSTNLLSMRSKYRLLSEALRHSQPPATEESLAEFVARKFGAEVSDYLVDPFVSTIFFSDARKLGMLSAFPALVAWERGTGSVVRGAIRAYKSKKSTKDGTVAASADRKASPTDANEKLRVTDSLPTLGSFKNGVGTLTERLAKELKDELRLESPVESLLIDRQDTLPDHSAWTIHTQSLEEFRADAVVLALPAYAAASLLQPSAPPLSSLLSAIEQAPMNVVASAYHRKQVRHPLDGFGFMVPRKAGLHTVCTIWNSSLFPGRAPEGSVLMTSFAASESNHLLNASEHVLAQTVEAENAKILGITGAPIDRAVWKYPRALPQYTIGHAQRVQAIAAALNEFPGLYLAGNYLSGRSIGDCVATGFQAADNLHSHMRT
jgi:oxygen-dependent protoporphyrinogen oxidase